MGKIKVLISITFVLQAYSNDQSRSLAAPNLSNANQRKVGPYEYFFVYWDNLSQAIANPRITLTEKYLSDFSQNVATRRLRDILTYFELQALSSRNSYAYIIIRKFTPMAPFSYEPYERPNLNRHTQVRDGPIEHPKLDVYPRNSSASSSSSTQSAPTLWTRRQDRKK